MKYTSLQFTVSATQKVSWVGFWEINIQEKNKKHSDIESNLDTVKQLNYSLTVWLHLLVRNTLSPSPTHTRWLVEHELQRQKVSSCKLIFEQCFIALCYGREHTHTYTGSKLCSSSLSWCRFRGQNRFLISDVTNKQEYKMYLSSNKSGENCIYNT